MAVSESVQVSVAKRGDRGVRHAAALRGNFDHHRHGLLDMLAIPGEGGVVLARRHAEIADLMLRDLFTRVGAGRGPNRLLMGAVGGYGRRLLGLGSDLDVCFVTDGPRDAVAPVIEAILYPLWDAGVSVGHQLVRPDEIAEDVGADLPMATELLDFRPIAGDTELMHAVRACLWSSIFTHARVPDFIERLQAQADKRRRRFGDTVYLLEPDLKNGTGGLRDLDVALWAARARFGTGDLDRLVSLGVLSRRQRDDVAQALDFLWTARNHLHRAAGRKADRLTFAAQETIAVALGYEHGHGDGASELDRIGAMVEGFMSDFYRHARAIARVRDRIMGHAHRRTTGPRPTEEVIGEGFVACHGRIGLQDRSGLSGDPALALRLYREAVRRDMPLLGRTRDAIAAAAADPRFGELLRDSPEAAALFVELVCTCRVSPFHGGSILAELHDVGLLLAMIPEFMPVVGRVHHDLYHVFTVDVHSVAAVDRLRELTRGELAEPHPLACRLAAEVDRPRVLFLATLLHDVGKAIAAKDHASRGATMARDILARLGLSDDDIEDACHLIQHHLAMYVVAVRRDLGDPATVEEMARDVRGIEGLRDLYLLTIADVSTTSPTAMNRWKAGMLAALYRATEARMAGPGSGVSVRVARVRAQVRALWRDTATLPVLDAFLESMSDRYFLSNTPPEIAAHAALATSPRDTAVGMSLMPSRHDGVMGLCVVTRNASAAELCVVAGDRPGLLASISAAIAANGLAIDSAQVNSRRLPCGNQQAVDLFWVRAEGTSSKLDGKLAKLGRDLSAVVDGQLDPGSLLVTPKKPSWSVRPAPPVPTDVVFDHHGSGDHTIIEVLTQDRPALLFLLTGVLHELGVSISVAKISTEGRRAVDVFYANEADGTKIAAGPRANAIAAAIRRALDVTMA